MGIEWPILKPPHPDAVDHFVTGPTKPPRMYRAYDNEGRCFLIGEAGLEAYGPDILTPPHRVELPPEPKPEPLTESEIVALESLIERAAPAPWDMQGNVLFDTEDRVVLAGDCDHPDWHPSIELAAESRAALPRLVAEVRRLRADLASAERTISDLDYDVRRSYE